MAMIDYKCLECGFVGEYMTGFSAPKVMKVPEVCPMCRKGMMEAQFPLSNNIALNFIGSGFYCNDYGKNSIRNKSVSEQADILNGKNPY
jgi:predicted nucleic acid-binding Zn ribbon protein